ncbi:hypothetical protein [Burkholderia sp. Bp9140]|uniref:hypothetical protein n=1 Tax=Burkholderia sp. Bp9140 TaxID=2184572 RepID=UPI000F56317A|nr:hypothetical protein [Burkholderia sp. Bp9140]
MNTHPTNTTSYTLENWNGDVPEQRQGQPVVRSRPSQHADFDNLSARPPATKGSERSADQPKVNPAAMYVSHPEGYRDPGPSTRNTLHLTLPPEEIARLSAGNSLYKATRSNGAAMHIQYPEGYRDPGPSTRNTLHLTLPPEEIARLRTRNS